MKKAEEGKKPAERPPVKRFMVKIEVEGAMVDEDTPVSQQSLVDLFQMRFACPKGLKLLRVDAQELPE